MRDYAALEALAAKNSRLTDVFVRLGDQFVSLRSTCGLWLQKQSPQIGAPDVEGEQIFPPGFDFVLDLTQAVDSKVHFKQRQIRMTFACLRPKAQWDTIRSDLETALQGEWLSFYFSRSPDIQYQGQFAVELTPGKTSATVEITVTSAP